MLRKKWFRKSFAFNQYERDQWVAKAISELPQNKKLKILDAGAGDCPYRLLFKDFEYYTQDFVQLKPEQLLSKSGYGAIDYVCDITKIPVADGFFDVIICTEVFEHIPFPIDTIKEFSRILSPQGKLILTAPLQSGLHQEPYHFYGGYTPFWYNKFLKENGFKNISVEENGGFNKFFSQEAIRYLKYNWPLNNWLAFLLTPIWLLLFFVTIVISFLSDSLDKFEKEKKFTIGYHVLAEKE